MTDLHVAVAVRVETRSGLHDVFVDDAHRAKAHMRGVMVVSEGEAVPAFQPAVICIATCILRRLDILEAVLAIFSRTQRRLTSIQ